MVKTICYGVGVKNLVGEAHPRAVVSDDLAEFIRDIYDEGFLGYGAIAKAFGLKKRYVQELVQFRRRNTRAQKHRSVALADLKGTTMFTRLRYLKQIDYIEYDAVDEDHYDPMEVPIA